MKWMHMFNRGVLYGLGAYFIWGLFPIYWKLLKQVAAVQLLGHRVVWSFVLLALVISLTGKWSELRTLSSNRRTLRIYLAAAVLIGLNWFVFVWAVNSGYVVETSLGYFINPLLSVLMGVVLLRERLRFLQWVSIGFAAVGVIYLTLIYGRLPWIALSLAFTFGFYGLVKKIAPLSSLYGLTLETGILFIPAAIFLVWENWAGRGAFLHLGMGSNLLMAGAGLVTTVPLLLFASAARRVPLSTIGTIQYVCPTMQFLLGVLLYREAFSASQAIGFGIIWAGLIIFWVEGYISRRAVVAEPIPELGEG
jgi:chloramphenicol-sensitive protein RarD